MSIRHSAVLRNKAFALMFILLTIVFLLWLSEEGPRPPISGLANVVTVNTNFNPFTCKTSFEDLRTFHSDVLDLPTIYFITATYPRREQVAELIRVGQTLMHIPKLHWILADDNFECSALISSLLSKFKIPYTHIVSPMPYEYRISDKNLPRGVSNRRAALSWIRSNAKSGVFYFGDDDNTFDLQLFDEMRFTKKISMFPVGFIGEYGISSPVVRHGKVIGFFDSWVGDRKFPVDMAGFAINVKLFLEQTSASMPFRAGFEEDDFIRSLNVEMSDIEPKANNCSTILVWHTRTVQEPIPTGIRPEMSVMNDPVTDSMADTSIVALIEKMKLLGMADSDS